MPDRSPLPETRASQHTASLLTTADRHWWWLTPLILALFLLPGLGRSGLLDPWEMDRAAVARKMAAAPAVLVIEPGDGKLLDAVSKAAAGRYGLTHPFDRGDASAQAALSLGALRSGRQLSHAIVVDVDALLPDRDPKAVKVAAGPIAQLEAQNRGTAVVLVGSADKAALLQWPLALARAHELAETWKNTPAHALFQPESQEILLTPLFLNVAPLVAPANVVAALDALSLSPLTMPGFKQETATVSAPWLDSVLSALAIKALGVNEFAVRLPGALLAILAGFFVVFALRRLFRPVTGWLGLGIYATLPLTWGLARSLTLQSTEPAGLALFCLALALGVAGVWHLWVVAAVAGLALLAGGAGMGGMVTALVVAVGAVLATGRLRGALGAGLAMAAGATGLLALAVYTGDPDSLLLRSLRFTSWPFGGGPDLVHRDFAWFVGQAGFALYPWSAVVAMGAGQLLRQEDEEDTPQTQARAVLLLALVASLAIGAILIRKYAHFVAPIGPLAAVAGAVLLDALLAGRVSGRTVAIFTVLSTLLLHKEIGKGAEAVVRFIVFDPPLTMGTGNHPWPAELELPRALRAVTFLAVVAFALGAARPGAALHNTAAALRTRAGAAWALGTVGILWALDGIVSLGTKLDVMLKTLATTWNYPHDRIWVPLLGMRPEVIAGAVLFFVLLIFALLATVGGKALIAPVRLVLRAAGPVGQTIPALAIAAVAAVATLLGGLSRLVTVQNVSYGDALAIGATSGAFLVSLKVLVVAGILRALAKPGSWLDPDGEDSLLQPLAAGLVRRTPLVFGLLGLWALASLGVGASLHAMTWSWAYFGGMWLLAIGTLLVVLGNAGPRAASYPWPLTAIGLWVYGTVMTPMAMRYLDEVVLAAAKGQEGAGWKEGLKYLAKVAVTAPDSGGLLVVALLVLVNRLALHKKLARRAVDLALAAADKLEQPRLAATVLVLAGTVFTAGYGWSLLPGLSVHYSQKHLLTRIAEAGGTGVDPAGSPRTFTHGSAKSGGESNFYTASMPQIDDRQAVLALLADKNVAVRIADAQAGGLSGPIALPGWDALTDRNHDGKRDEPGYFGVAQTVDGVRLGVPGAALQAGSWKGAMVYGPGDVTGVVADNGTDWIALTSPISLAAGDPVKGAFVLDKLTGVEDAQNHAAAAPTQRFVVLPKDAFSEVNHAFRELYHRHITVLDAASSRLVLAANHLTAGQSDQNWVKQAILTPAEFDALPGVKKVFANFDNSIHLIGYKMTEYSVQRSSKYKMTFYWKVIKPTATSWKLFMHPHPLHLDRWPLTNPDPSEDENKPCGGCFATNHWMQGDIIADSFEQEVALGTQSGPNDIILGWYNPSSDQRMTLLSASGQGVTKHGDNRVTIGQVQVR